MVKSNWFICFSVTSWRFHGFFLSDIPTKQSTYVQLRRLRECSKILWGSRLPGRRVALFLFFLFVHFSPGSQLCGPGFLLSLETVPEGFAQLINFIEILGYCFTRKNPYFWGKISLVKNVSYKSLRRGNSLPIGCLPKMGVFRPLFSANTQDMFLYTERIRNFGMRKTRLYVFVYRVYTKFRDFFGCRKNWWYMFLYTECIRNFEVFRMSKKRSVYKNI